MIPILKGSYVEPQDHDKMAITKIQLRSFLIGVLDEEHHSSVLHCSDPKEIWSIVLSMCEGSSGLMKFNIKKELQMKGQTMIKYTLGLSLIIIKLNIVGVKLEDDDVIINILMDLSRRFDNFKETCLMTMGKGPLTCGFSENVSQY